jgi:hypothetical protein
VVKFFWFRFLTSILLGGSMAEKHPQQREGEVYMGRWNCESFAKSVWETKRKEDMGEDGGLIDHGRQVAVFVSENELRVAGIDPDRIDPDAPIIGRPSIYIGGKHPELQKIPKGKR